MDWELTYLEAIKLFLYSDLGFDYDTVEEMIYWEDIIIIDGPFSRRG